MAENKILEAMIEDDEWNKVKISTAAARPNQKSAFNPGLSAQDTKKMLDAPSEMLKERHNKLVRSLGAIGAAEAEREANEEARKKEFDAAEAKRKGEFDAAEAQRQTDFEAAYAQIKEQYDALGVDQTRGNSKTKVMSQYAVTKDIDYMLKPCVIIPKIRGYYIDTNGVVRSSPSFVSEMTYKIPCTLGDEFEYTGRADYEITGVVFWQNDTLLSYLQTTTGKIETLNVTIPENCNYVQFCSYDFTSVVLIVTKKSPTYYTGSIKELEKSVEKFDTLNTELLQVAGIESNENLFIEDDTRNIADAYINSAGSIAYLASSRLLVSHPIKVLGGVTYKYQATYHIVNSSTAYIAICDEGGNCQSVFTSDEVIADGRWVIFTPESDCYVRLTLSPTVYPTMVAPVDNYPASYVKGRRIMTGVSIPYNNIVGLDEIESGNPLLGKKLSVNGDSICQGAGSTGGYARYIGQNNGMTVQNVGISGGTITAETYADDGTTARHWICRTISNMDADADFAIVEGGVNDAAHKETLGALTSGYNDALDDTTFYGAFESMLKQLIARFAGKKYGYIAVHKMVSGYRSTDDEATSYYWAAKKCCEKWGVPFLDLNISVPPFERFSAEGNAALYALRTTYTHNGDGWHPNEEGYLKYYVPKIEAWLKTL